MNLIDVAKSFATEDQCLDFLEQMRWPEGVRFPVCGNDKVAKVERKATSKNCRKWFYLCQKRLVAANSRRPLARCSTNPGCL